MPGESSGSESQGIPRPAAVPPKPSAEEPKSRLNVWIRSITSLALYLLVGYYFFQQNWLLVVVLTAVVVFHELGHFVAMKAYNYTELGIFFIPLVGAYASGKKHEVSQLQSSVILLAGPVPGIIIGVILHFTGSYFGGDPRQVENIAKILVFLNILNLLPIYPLDGGQLLNRLFLDSSEIISKIFLILSAAFLVWFALFGMYRPFYPLLLIPFFLISRLFSDSQYDRLTKKVEEQGFNLTTTYEEISDEDYWKIRNVLIRHHAAFRDIPEAPPYEYSEKEDQVKSLLQNLLQRSIVQDLSTGGKFLILVIWAACFAAPFLMGMPLSF